MNEKKIEELFPDLEKIKEPELRQQVVATWIESLQKGNWLPEELSDIPFTLLIEDVKINLIQHTNNVTKLAITIANEYKSFYKDLEVNMDILIAGALLHDVAKLLEYERKDNKIIKSKIGKYLRHPIAGAGLAAKHGLPDEVVHIIGSHSKEGEHARRTIEAIIIHHADFLNFEPFIK